MANELEWLRGKARKFEIETMVVDAEQAAAAECGAGTYKIERFSFVGTIPFHMVRALRGSKLIQSEAENEVLHLGTGYRGGECACRYYRTTYTLAA